jgi:NifU-like protein
MHCSVMGQEALEAAIYKYRGIEVEHHDDDDEGTLICKCFGITEPKIKRVIRENDLTTVEQVTNYIKAGGGCGSCQADIEDILPRCSRSKTPAGSRQTSHAPTGAADATATVPNAPSSPHFKKSP